MPENESYPRITLEFLGGPYTVGSALGGAVVHNFGKPARSFCHTLQVKAGETDLGYSEGDNVTLIGASADDGSAAIVLYCEPGAEDTQISYRFSSRGNPVRLLNKTTGVSSNITVAKWDLYITVFA